MFTDKNGDEINIGDIVRPNAGRDLLIISIAYNRDYDTSVMYGQQLEDSAAFSILTAENLAQQFTKVVL